MKPQFARRALALAALLSVPAALWLIASNRPVEGGFFPPCVFHLATGLHCPGCGATRAIHLALNGNLVGALGQNLLLVLVLPLAAVYAFGVARYAITGCWSPPRLTNGKVALAIAIVVIGFGIARNLPGLEALAPQPLTE